MYRRVCVPMPVVFVVLTCAYRALGLSEGDANETDQTLQQQQPQQQQTVIKAERAREDAEPYELMYSYNVTDPLMMGNVFRIAFEVSNVSSSKPKVSVDFVANDQNVPLRFQLVYNITDIRTNAMVNGKWDLNPKPHSVRGFAELFAPGRTIYLDFHVIDQFTYFVNLNNDGSFILFRSNDKDVAPAVKVRRIDVIVWDAYVEVDSEKVLLVNCKGHGI